MFTTHAHHKAICAECGSEATENQYADGASLPLFITADDDLNDLELSTWDGDCIELYNGQLLCEGCADEREPDTLGDDFEQALRSALTPGEHYQLRCDQCSKPACEADGDDFPLEWTEPVMTDWAASGLRVDGWHIDGDQARCSDCALVPAASI